MSLNIEKYISPLIQSQFPQFYQSEGPNFIQFVKAYYQFLENGSMTFSGTLTNGNNVITNTSLTDVLVQIGSYVTLGNFTSQVMATNSTATVLSSNFMGVSNTYANLVNTFGGSESRNILSYRDIDTTVSQFLKYFKDEYLSTIPYTTSANTAYLVKHIQDLYKSKGSTQSYQLLFQLLFGQNVSIYNPGRDIIKPSDGVWIVPLYIECSKNENSFSYIGQQIVGSQSGAVAFVDSVSRKNLNGILTDIIYLNDIQGQFITGEAITANGNFNGAPIITGSLNSISVVNGGANNKIGDLFTVTGGNGNGAYAIVTGITNGTGKVSFTLQDGGYGISNTSNVVISNTSLSFANLQGAYTRKMYVAQPLTQFVYSTISGRAFSVGDPVSGYAGATLVGNGYIVANNSGNTLWISVSNGYFLNANSIVNSINSATSNATWLNSADITAKAYVVGANTSQIGVINQTGTFLVGAQLVGYYQSPIGIVTGTTTSATLTGNTTYFANTVNPGDILYVRSTGVTVGVVNSVVSNTSLTLIANSTVTLTNNTMIWRSTPIATSNVTQLYNTTASGAGFNIGSLINQETIPVYTTVIGSNNSVGTNFLDMLISGNNSGVAANAYGFVANTNEGYNSIMASLWGTANITIGTVSSITNVDIGQYYSAAPWVYIDDSIIDNLDKFHSIINLSQTNSLFVANNIVYQQLATTQYSLTLPSVTGSFILGEGIIQNSTNAYGLILYSNSTYMLVNAVSGAFTSAQYVIGQESGANTTPSAVITQSGNNIIVRGLIKSISGNSMLIERMSYLYDFQPNLPIYTINLLGSQVANGVIGNILQYANTYTDMGINPVVATQVVTANGIATTLKVLSSGFGYQPASTVTLTSVNASSVNIYGSAGVYTSGTGNGYWYDNRGKPSMTAKLADNYYYQQYSYEVRSKLPLQNYAEILKKVLHVAGTQMFGRVMIDSEQNTPLYTPGALVNIQYANGSTIIVT